MGWRFKLLVDGDIFLDHRKPATALNIIITILYYHGIGLVRILSLRNHALRRIPILLIRLMDLVQPRLGRIACILHLVLDLIDLFLLLTDNMSQILVYLIDLVHPMVDLSDFLFPFSHDLLVETVLLQLELDLLLLLLQYHGGLVSAAGSDSRCHIGSGARVTPLLVLPHLPCYLGLRGLDGRLDPFKVSLQFQQRLLLRAGLIDS